MTKRVIVIQPNITWQGNAFYSGKVYVYTKFSPAEMTNILYRLDDPYHRGYVRRIREYFNFGPSDFEVGFVDFHRDLTISTDEHLDEIFEEVIHSSFNNN